MDSSAFGPVRSPGIKPFRQVLVLITEDWFLLSHFRPLVRALKQVAAEVVVATRPSGRTAEIEALGARVVAFDFRRSSAAPWDQALVAWRTAQLLALGRPDVVHAVALKPIALACAVLPFARVPHLVLHLTGVGFAGTSASAKRPSVHSVLSRVIARALGREKVRLFVENPDDAEALRRYARIDQRRVTILGGAGIDPAHYPAMPQPSSLPVRVGFVGRMIWSKGVDVLVDAQRRLAAKGERLDLVLCGAPDPGNPRAFGDETLRRWAAEPGITWLGKVGDIAGFWRDTAIAAVPSRGGEGLPRALLEAAACARPLIVTDVPGCRRFVRDGVEGLIVPPGDPAALAEALSALARDKDRRAAFGAAARARVLDGFTESDVEAAVVAAYATMPHPSTS